MAIVKLGSFLTSISGKVSGSVYLANKGGTVVRINVKPSSSKKPSPVLLRSYMRTSVTRWRSLTEAQRASWNSQALNYSGASSEGVTRELTGFQYFTRVQYQSLLFANVLITTPPALIALANYFLSAATVSVGGASATLTCSTFGATSGQTFLFSVSKPVSKGVLSAKRNYTIVTSNTVALVGFNFYTQLVAVIGTPIPGMRLWFRLQLFSNQTGQKAPAQFVSCVIT